MTALDGPLGRPRFSRTSSRVMSPRALELLHPHPLTLLHFLHGLIDYETGALREGLTYRHQDGAKALGIPVRTARDFFDRLEQADLLRSKRTFRGLRFRLLGLPPGKWHQAATYEPEGGTERQHAATNEEIVAGSCTPSGSVLPLVKESKESEKGGERTLIVDQAAPTAPPTPLAPPGAERFSEETVEAVRLGEAMRGQRFSEEVRLAISYKLEALPSPALRLPALRAAVQVMGSHPEWKATVPATWAGQIEKAAAAKQASHFRPPPAPAPTAPAPALSDADWERAGSRIAEIQERLFHRGRVAERRPQGMPA